MSKSKSIESFFKKKDVANISPVEPASSNIETPTQRSFKMPRIEPEEVDISNLERDPSLRQQIWDYPTNKRDEVRRAYIKAGPYQFLMDNYPLSGKTDHQRRFQPDWFKVFPNWLEYSPAKDAAFCLPCFLFNKRPT